MTDFIDRLKQEKDELYERLTKLRQFIASDKFDSVHPVQKKLLRSQVGWMGRYHRVLVSRLEHLGEL